jgi:hypothetical protein
MNGLADLVLGAHGSVADNDAYWATAQSDTLGVATRMSQGALAKVTASSVFGAESSKYFAAETCCSRRS